MDELVPVMVPRRVLEDVYRLIGSTQVERARAQPAPSAPPEKWGEDMLRRAVEESPPGMRVIFEALASAPNTWLTSEDLAHALRDRLPHHGGPNKPKADWNTVAGTLGAFGRRVRSRYGREQGEWPFAVRFDYERDRWTYSMSPEVASRVLKYL